MTLKNINICFRLTPYPLQNKSGSACIEELSKRLLALGATQAGHFLVDGDIFENCKKLTFAAKLLHKQIVSF